MNNPYDESDVDLVTPPGRYFKGNINEAVNELFRRSAEGASWYAQKCGGDVLTTKGLSELVTKLTTSMDQMITFLRRQKPPHYQNGTWPTGFQMLPGIVFLILQNPCHFARPSRQYSAFDELSIFNLITALDSTGKWQVNQAAKEIATVSRC